MAQLRTIRRHLFFRDWVAGPPELSLDFYLPELSGGKKINKNLPKPEQRKIRFWPHDRVGEITIIALIFGLIGAKLFDIFENWNDFLKEPSSYIFSPAD